METKSKSSKKSAKSTDESKLREFFIDELKDIYWAEQALYKALPKMAQAATSKKLAKAFEKHTMETEGQIATLEKAFELLGEKAEAKKCKAMEGLLKEADSVIEDTDEGTHTRDVGLIVSSQKAEHYEIASYGALTVIAENIGEPKVAKLLKKILDEEKKTDISLSIVAENKVNASAAKE
ncbi:ferritin-like domain-containing protein [Xylanibacter muris]|uniref:Ferritin-like domain-containing protein n=1 Tax=Xylanibacter muris TaxID=2736290 RepID=A0ABX2AIY2_9BACT|nr:ferritin-like domain-containing protein [Xylanibacter muris]NPD91038.1 ferritin-like domain-containing protein [Xylanibacter muris]